MSKQIFAPTTERQYTFDHWESESELSFTWNSVGQAETNENWVFEEMVSDRKLDAAKSNLTTIFVEILSASRQLMEIEFSRELILSDISASEVWIQHFDNSIPNRSD